VDGSLVEDDRQDHGEVRSITIGFPDETLVVLVRTPSDAHRIISMKRRGRVIRNWPKAASPTGRTGVSPRRSANEYADRPRGSRLPARLPIG